MKKLRTHIVRGTAFLIISLVCLSLSLLIFYRYQLKRQKEAVYTNKIVKNIEDEIQKVSSTFQDIKPSLRAGRQSFASLNTHSPYPYFIFKNNLLVFWSDNRQIPNIRELTGDYEVKLLQKENNSYLVRQYHITDKKATIYFVIPLFERPPVINQYLKPNFNDAIFDHISFEVFQEHKPNTQPVTYKDKTLFHIKFGGNYKTVFNDVKWVVYLLLFIGGIMLLVFLFKNTRKLHFRNQYGLVILILLIVLIIIRGLMLYFNFPFNYFSSSLFNPRYYASSAVNPSLGDLLLNMLVILVVSGYLFRIYYKTVLVKKVLAAKHTTKRYISVILMLLSYLLLSLVFILFTSLYRHSQWNMDITQEVDFGYIKIISFVIILLGALIYFLYTHIIARLFLKINRDLLPHMVINFLIASVVFTLIGLIDNWVILPIIIINTVFYVILYLLNLPIKLYRIQFLTFVYFFISSLPVAAVGSYAIYQWHHKNLNMEKERLASQLLVENDILTEFMLKEIGGKIANDVYIQNRIYNPYVSKRGIKQKIKRVYLNNNLEKYEVDIYMFNSSGTSIDKENPFGHIREVKALKEVQKVDDNLYFVRQYGENASIRYLRIIELQRYKRTSGYILLDFRMRKVVPDSVYPLLLIDSRYSEPTVSSNYSYGVFENGKLLFSSGDFGYGNETFISKARNNAFKEGGWVNNGFQHYGVKGDNGRWVLISYKAYPLQNIISNFSFIYLIELVGIIGFLLFVSLYFKVRNIQQNYATRIQLYLSVAFFTPLFIVSISSVSVLIKSYKEDVEYNNILRSRNISNLISQDLDKYFNNQISNSSLLNKVSEIARYSELDINIFYLNGRLLATNQPPIYESNLLSENINPKALMMMERGKVNGVIVNEKVGDLTYKNIYVGVKSFDSGELIAVLSLPFFDSKNELERSVITVLTNVMNIFTVIFLVFLIISYLSSRWLTFPLRLITQKIRKTSFLQTNEPLEWKSEDEIGLMVGEYNKMLLNLEKSKKALAKSEKETAWREIARQVAHEIKNPLTPMKLTLQHMRRTIADINPENLQLSQIDGLINQINTLSDIASSFSDFAKMPVPQNETFELKALVQETVALYNKEENAKITTELGKGGVKFIVNADRQLLGQAISNIIINGIHASEGRTAPAINVELNKNGKNKCLLKIMDNGEGISDDIRHKIFMPNFSTKSSGSGIGLAIARRAVEHAAGDIWFDTGDHGTTFYIELPLIK